MWYRYVTAWTLDTAGLPPARRRPCRLLLPALRFPARFVPRVLGPSELGALLAPVVGAVLGSPCTSPGGDTATASSTSSSQSPAVSMHVSDAAGPALPLNP
jgi:hypothetical protein